MALFGAELFRALSQQTITVLLVQYTLLYSSDISYLTRNAIMPWKPAFAILFTIFFLSSLVVLCHFRKQMLLQVVEKKNMESVFKFYIVQFNNRRRHSTSLSHLRCRLATV